MLVDRVEIVYLMLECETIKSFLRVNGQRALMFISFLINKAIMSLQKDNL